LIILIIIIGMLALDLVDLHGELLDQIGLRQLVDAFNLTLAEIELDFQLLLILGHCPFFMVDFIEFLPQLFDSFNRLHKSVEGLLNVNLVVLESNVFLV